MSLTNRPNSAAKIGCAESHITLACRLAIYVLAPKPMHFMLRENMLSNAARPIIVTVCYFLILAAYPVALYADVYRCRDNNGGLVYQDTPCIQGQYIGHEGAIISTSNSFEEVVYKCEVKTKDIVSKRHTIRAKCIISVMEKLRGRRYMPPELVSLFRQVDTYRLLLAERIDNNEITVIQAKSMFYDYVENMVNSKRVVGSVEKIGNSLENLAITASQPTRITPFSCSRIGNMVHCF